MRNVLLFAMLFMASVCWVKAQISYGGTPPSIQYGISSSDVDLVVLTPLTSKQLQEENDKYPKDGRVPFIGYSIFTDLSPENSGTWTELPNGGRIWRLQIKAPSALALGVYYDRFKLPYGAKLFLYNEDKTQILGAYTYQNNDESGMFANEMVYGDIVCLEYYEPERCVGKPEIHINEIAYFYRGVSLRKNPSWTEPSEPCEVNINCSPVGDNWQDEKRGVCRILLKIGNQYAYCTGSLVNNTAQDCTPYV
ncbi:MAG: protease, partial [Bacteroidales bacterium]|nr:protease [Bacteroidales bacterium]